MPAERHAVQPVVAVLFRLVLFDDGELDAFKSFELRRARHGGAVPKVHGFRGGDGGKGGECKSKLECHGSFS